MAVLPRLWSFPRFGDLGAGMGGFCRVLRPWNLGGGPGREAVDFPRCPLERGVHWKRGSSRGVPRMRHGQRGSSVGAIGGSQDL